MKNVKSVLEKAIKNYDEDNKDIEEIRRSIRAREFTVERKLNKSVNEMANYLRGKAVNDNIIRFIPTVSNLIDSKMAAEILMEIAPIVELEVGDKVTKEIKALGLEPNGWGNAVVLSYRSLPDGYHYTIYKLIINIDDDTITHIQVYYFKRQI